jgi:hypothetical protein
MTHVFVTNCIDAVGEDINEMKDISIKRDISTRYFIEKIASRIGIDKELIGMLGFDTKTQFANDWALRCASSFYQGIPCYYVQWSAIEYIFVDEDVYGQVLDADQAHVRQSIIADLTESVEDLVHDRQPASEKDRYALAIEFEKANHDVLQQNRIPLSALAQYRCDHSNAFALFDKKHFGKELIPGCEGRTPGFN